MVDIGHEIDGYRLVAHIGTGGCGEIYKAEALGPSSPFPVVAIKVLRTDLPPTSLQQIHNEAQYAKILNHKNIVKIYRFEEIHNPNYLMMQYASKGSLRKNYPRGMKIPIGTIVIYTKQIAEALLYLHERNYIHRDVKPENILLSDDDILLLSDFGITVELSNSPDQNRPVSQLTGTFAYMAPELFDGQHPSAKSDQYALGVMVYEWLCGQCPFRGTDDELRRKHVHESPAPLYTKQINVSAYVEDVVRKALEKKPEARYPDVMAFANALEEAYNSTMKEGVNSLTMKHSSVTPYIPPESGQESARKSKQSSNPLEIPRRAFLWLSGVVLLASWATELSKLSHFFSLPPSQGETLQVYRGHTDNVNSVVWSPDGSQIASASWDGTVQVWDAATGDHLVTYVGHRDLTNTKDITHVNGVAWSPDGKFIVSCSNKKKNQVHIWDATSREAVLSQPIWVCAGHKDAVNAVAWSPKNDYIASASFDGTVRVWNWDSIKYQASLAFLYPPDAPLKGQLFDVAWSPDAQYFAFCATSTEQNWWIVKTDGWKQQNDGWQGQLGYPIQDTNNSPKDVLSISWSCTNQYIAIGTGSSDGAIHIYDPRAQREVMPSYTGHKTSVRRVAWSPDCQVNLDLIASADIGGLIRLWRSGSDVQDAYPPFKEHQGFEVNALAWSPDGQKIASGGKDYIVRVWQAIDLLNQ